MHDQIEWSVKENTYSEPMSPGLITILIVARVSSVSDPSNLLGGAIKSNDVMIGKYVYDSGIPDSYPADPSVAQYNFTSSSCGIELRAGGFVFKTDPSNVYFFMYIGNNWTLPFPYPVDMYSLRSLANLQLSNGMQIYDIKWGLIDHNALSLSTDALPTTAPLVNAYWEPYPGLEILGSHPSDPTKKFMIQANVTRAIKSNTMDVSEVENNQDISSVTIPYSYAFLRFWVNVFQRFSHAFPILRHLMGY